MTYIASLQYASAFFAFIAAAFWFQSATTPAPPATYEGIDRLPAWLDSAARLNRRAAAAACISAVLAGFATLGGSWVASQ
jgi:hypothetical protein